MGPADTLLKAEPSQLARKLSGHSAQLLADALAAAGHDETLSAVLTAHAKQAQPPLAQSLRHRLQQDAELDAGALDGRPYMPISNA